MSDILDIAIKTVLNSESSFCRFITANDTGSTGSNQSGFYIPKCASSLLFEIPVIKGENKDKFVKIKWQDSFETDSRFIYYGVGTRNEYRITRFGRGFPFLSNDNVGNLLILAKLSKEDYAGFVLSSDDDIDSFFSFFNLSSESTNQLIPVANSSQPEIKLAYLFSEFVNNLNDFPETKVMAEKARNCYNSAYHLSDNSISKKPDDILLKWIEAEYDLFKAMENKIYSKMLQTPFTDVSQFVEKANQILNRRKSRAGKSLEHHLACVFDAAKLIYEEQVITEDKKKPDFIFPNGLSYHDLDFPSEFLVSLAAKTTCKDRWRQILNESNRISEKHLFTLQQGISSNQLYEMYDENVRLVVPHKYLTCFPKEYRSSIMDLQSFINFVREKQLNMPKTFVLN